jgi:hypothetical protein
VNATMLLLFTAANPSNTCMHSSCVHTDIKL